MNYPPQRSLAARIAGFALAVLAAGWAITTAMRLLTTVWPALLITAVVAAVVYLAVRFRSGRGQW